MIELLAVGVFMLTFCLVVTLLAELACIWLGIQLPTRWASRCFGWLRDRIESAYWYVRWWLAGGAYAR